MLSGLLLVAGLVAGVQATIVQGLELLGLALVAADAWGVRRCIPVLRSPDKAVAAGGWALLILGAIVLALGVAPL
ncbi:MAG TPA: hypothetical protein VMW62_06850 [Chloroflexota bacterium]|nr:hypothetical protein [Chloroflexota bacterium]